MSQKLEISYHITFKAIKTDPCIEHLSTQINLIDRTNPLLDLVSLLSLLHVLFLHCSCLKRFCVVKVVWHQSERFIVISSKVFRLILTFFKSVSVDPYSNTEQLWDLWPMMSSQQSTGVSLFMTSQSKYYINKL